MFGAGGLQELVGKCEIKLMMLPLEYREEESLWASSSFTGHMCETFVFVFQGCDYPVLINI